MHNPSARMLARTLETLEALHGDRSYDVESLNCVIRLAGQLEADYLARPKCGELPPVDPGEYRVWLVSVYPDSGPGEPLAGTFAARSQRDAVMRAVAYFRDAFSCSPESYALFMPGGLKGHFVICGEQSPDGLVRVSKIVTEVAEACVQELDSGLCQTNCVIED